MLGEPAFRVQGFKFQGLGANYHNLNGLWNLKPEYSGPWPLWVGGNLSCCGGLHRKWFQTGFILGSPTNSKLPRLLGGIFPTIT